MNQGLEVTWVVAAGWGNDDSRKVRSTHSALLHSLASSLEQGHWRVACRRYLMIRARAWPVPESIRSVCEANLGRCTPRERAKMVDDALAWALRSAPQAHVASEGGVRSHAGKDAVAAAAALALRRA